MSVHYRVFVALGLVLACGRPLPAEEPICAGDSNLPDVVWTTPSADSKGSMPIGNGDIGANVWVEPSGDLVFFISKTDAWDENMRLVKIGKVRVKFTPPLIQPDKPFQQSLDFANGRILVETDETEVSFWIDANHPVIQIDAKSLGGQKLAMTAAIESWRTSKHACNPGYPNFSAPAFSWPDTPLKATSEQIGWFHRNVDSPWRPNLKLQKLEAIADEQPDPILDRTFGAILRGVKLTTVDDATLSTSQPAEQFSLSVHVLTQTKGTAEAWQIAIEKQANRVEAISAKDRWTAHSRWWNDFWNRSWIHLQGNKDAESVSRAYALQRWMNACGGRGEYPIKFNGSIFVIDHDNKTGRDADYRAWGGCYWWQNTRLIYWPMLMSGDFEMMRPLFKLYLDALPSRKLATRTYYGHDGAFFPETMTFWGTYNDKNYGPNRTNKADGITDNAYIRRYWLCGIEMVAIMLDYYDSTQDSRFRDETLIPFATEIVAFFDQHWQRGSDGTILFKPAQSLETWHTAANPLPEIAGLRYVLPRLTVVTSDAALKASWQKTLDDLPAVPLRHHDKTGEDYLAPADSYSNLKNTENPELYAIFPFRMYTVAADPKVTVHALGTSDGPWSF